MSPSARTSTAPSLLQICLTTTHTVAIDAVQLLGPIDCGLSCKPHPTGLDCGFVFVSHRFQKFNPPAACRPDLSGQEGYCLRGGGTRWLSMKVPHRLFST